LSLLDFCCVDRAKAVARCEVLAKNFGVPVEAFKNIPVHNKWIYQTQSLLFGPNVGARVTRTAFAALSDAMTIWFRILSQIQTQHSTSVEARNLLRSMRPASPSYSAGLEFELTGVAQGVELA
jgi:hypothetical protein